MGAYRARDLLLPPSLVSLSRLPLAVAFHLQVNEPAWAMGILAAAGLSDLLDGYLARRHGQATATGAVVDGVTDKVFVLTVAVTLLLNENLSLAGTLALGLRDLGEVPLVLWWAACGERRRARAQDPKANRAGKVATVLQFASVAAALFQSTFLTPLLVASAAGGVWAAASYWRRELSVRRASRPAEPARPPKV
jgi:CDP-diacylglycerol--glycerol-3-phosphate 3-phosphatidyltransferase/cardiolipin synthase